MIRILQLTDLHVFATPNERLKGIPTRESLQEVVQFISQNEQPFAHVVVTGDHTHDELPDSYAAVAEILQPWADRLWQISGNHDDRSILRNTFSNRISGEGDQHVQFEFTAADWHLIGLDTQLPGEVSGQINEPQIEWLTSILDQTAAKSVALFMHHPPVDVNSVWMDAIGLKNRELLQKVVMADERVRLICCGHVHHEFESAIGPAKVMTTPSTGIQFSPEGDTPNFAADAPGYRVIELDGQTFSTHVVRVPEIRYSPVTD